jgi:ribosomal protein S18 acetylase RimI-like enzyme
MNSAITIAPFTEANYEDYLRIYENYYIQTDRLDEADYFYRIGQNGFLVGEPASFDSFLASPFAQCAYIRGKAVGIIRIDKIITSFYGIGYTLTWNCTEDIKALFNNKHGVEIGVIMIDPEYRKQDIATTLFYAFFEYAKKNNVKNIFSWVVSKPENVPSFHLHQKLGFTGVAIYKAQEEYGIKNYESKLLYKLLSV